MLNVIVLKLHNLPWAVSCNACHIQLRSIFVPIFSCNLACLKCDAAHSNRIDVFGRRAYLLFYFGDSLMCTSLCWNLWQICACVRVYVQSCLAEFIYFHRIFFLWFLHVVATVFYCASFLCKYVWRHHDKIMVTIHIYGAPVNISILIKRNKIIHVHESDYNDATIY